MRKASQIITFFLLLSTLISCTKENNEATLPNPNDPALVGKWKDAGIKGSITIVFMDEKSTIPLDESATDALIEFKADGTVTDLSLLGDDTQFTKYKTSGNQLIISGIENNKPVEFLLFYKISGKSLLLTMDKELLGKNAKALDAVDSNSFYIEFLEFINNITDFTFENTYQKV
jgi:hypothetical protein